MTRHLCISVILMDEMFHGKLDGDLSEWPPSPMRLFQALLCGARTGCRNREWSDAKADSFRWLEQRDPPIIVAPDARPVNGYMMFVPNNDSDKEFHRQNRLTSKVARPHSLVNGQRLYYLWQLENADWSSIHRYAKLLCSEAQHILALGWGIDQAVGNGCILTEAQVRSLDGIRWRPSPGQGNTANSYRVPIEGTLQDLEEVYQTFIDSVNGRQYTPPLKPSTFRRVEYIPSNVACSRPYRVFELRNTDGSLSRYPHRKLIHLAGMIRHLAIEAMKRSPPKGLDDDWIETYVAGHLLKGEKKHKQLSYLPLPSVGHQHTNPGVRRVMIAAPLGDDDLLDYVARRLAGQVLKPLQGDEFRGGDPPLLVPIKGDSVSRRYTGPANIWHSFTPVILPGHDDHKPDKTRKLIEKALRQSGVDQACEFTWSAFSRFPKSFSAHKYDRIGRPSGYIRPDHLLSQTAVHLELRFKGETKIPGPLAIGAGRHCGLGLFATMESS